MGLDMYLTIERTLSPNSRKQKKLIKFLAESANAAEIKIDHYGWYLSEYSNTTKVVKEGVNRYKIYGQVGLVETITFQNDVWGVSTEAYYWRKANYIHNWFVKNVQNGVDDCGKYKVTKAHIQQLIDVIGIVLKNPETATALLPTHSGFFFGNTEYGYYYYSTLRRTRRGLQKLLRPKTLKNWTIYYNSSW